MLEPVIFQTQLTSIMEALSTAAVAEITKLVDEYSAFLRVELSRKKHDNEMLINKLKVVETSHRTKTPTIEHRGASISAVVLRESLQNDDSAASRFLLGRPILHHTPPASKEQKPETVFAQTGGSRDWGHESGAGVEEAPDTKATPVTIKQERLEDDHEPMKYTDQTINAAEHSATHLVTGQQHPTDQPCFEEDWEFQNTPPGGIGEHTDSVERHSQLEQRTVEHHLELEHRTVEHISSNSHCQDNDLAAGVLFHLKREPGSPNHNLLPGIETGAEVNQEDLSKTYPEYAALSLGYGGYTGSPYTFFSYSSENQLHTSATTTTNDSASLPGRHFNPNAVPGVQGDQAVSGGTVRRPRAPLSKDKEGRFVCKHCGKGFPYISYLRRHTLNHTGERTHHCSVCGRSFIRQSHLRRHELLHTGVRPFTCALCGRHFSRGAHLRAHMKTHM
ncbi:hypothetical protein UPYG_G00043840 [Umbra pygmaea]|uniref:C2H2-type domain-containing protein n=1 Tax=Umbra pygmaea TaxID=75934 RepID=A0ABD0XQL5_UMBPY